MKKTLFAMLAMAAALSASATTIELLTNGAGTTLEGWTNTYSGSGYVFEIETKYDASWFASSFNACQLSQTVALSEANVQAYPVVTASGIVIAADQKNNSNSGSTICNVKVYELDAGGSTLATHVIMDRAGELISSPVSFSNTFKLNSSTRKLKYELNGQDSVNWSGTYGPKFRNCSLTISSPDIDYSQARLTKRENLTSGTDANLVDGTIYDVNGDLTLSASAGYSKFRVLGSSVVAINIKKNVTLTLNGGNATGTTGAGAAISVAPNATLYLLGEGTLIANGGAAGNGSNGSSGESGAIDDDDEDGRGGNGGPGGYGGGGGAPAIGGYGGEGGYGGSKGEYSGWTNCDGDNFNKNGGDGGNGSSGSNGSGMGKVVILGSVIVRATAGAEGSDGSGGSGGSRVFKDWTSTQYYCAGGGGGGGGGSRGQTAQYGIGGGGAGGAGGGGGGAGSTFCNGWDGGNKVASGNGGKGGSSYCGTSGGEGSYQGVTEAWFDGKKSTGGAGGAGGSANTTRGSNGTLEAMSSAALTVSPSRSASQPAALWGTENVLTACTITFYGKGTETASLMFPPPSAPSADKDGYAFLGYYTDADGGTQIYDANYKCVYSVWPFVDDMTLYPQWIRLSNITFMSEGNQVGTAIAQKGTTPPNAPVATKTDYRFLGYFTAATGGTIVYNSERYPLENTWNSTEDVIYYAQWEPVSVPFTVTLVSDGATAATVNARQNTSIASVDVPAKEYYAFQGYWTETTGGTKVFNADGTPVEATWTRYENLTLYAQWQPVNVPFTVTLISDGATNGTINAQQSYAIASVTPPTKASSMFTGYWTAETGGVKVFDSDGSPVEATWTRYENLTLYAQWTSAYSFTFVSTDATVGTGTYVDGDAQTAPVPVRSGDYAFLGYYTEKTGGERIFDQTGALVGGSVSGLSPETTLYAQWAVPEGSVAKLVYRGQLNLLTGVPATNDTSYTKKMHFRVYDSSEATTPLWSINDQVVTVNADGSFVHMFGDDDLSALIATGKVTHIGLAIGDSANLATELKPRRELRPVAAVNRALTAEGAALDIRVGNLVTENALVAADATVSHLEVAGTVNAYGAGKVSVSPLVVGAEERTRLLRGGGVKVFARANPTELTLLSSAQGTVSRGQEIAVAPSDGVALISCKAEGERALRCPAVIQYCKKDDKVRSPTYIEGGVKVTFFPFIGK